MAIDIQALAREWTERALAAGLPESEADALKCIAVRGTLDFRGDEDPTVKVLAHDRSHLLYALACALDEIARRRAPLGPGSKEPL